MPNPEGVQRVLSLGPMFAVEPQMSPPELLTLVWKVAMRAPEAETEHCVSEGVHVLLQYMLKAYMFFCPPQKLACQQRRAVL